MRPSSWKRRAKDLVAHAIARLIPPGLFRDPRYFELWQSRGYHVMPVHFYNPVPDTRRLEDDLWRRPSELVGVNMNEAGQLALLSEFAELYRAEYEAPSPERIAVPDWGVLYCMIRHFKPRRIVEIGSGESTRVSALASLKNRAESGIETTLTAIEPHPRDELIEGFPGLTELKAMPVQDVPLTVFEELDENDILFIDSSHMLKIGSDVQFEFLEVIPRLRPGVIVHVHDIFFPHEYPHDWVNERFVFWNEAYLLQAFLAFNSAFEVLWSSSYLHHRQFEAVRRAFSRYGPVDGVPSSFWMRRRKD